jgi:hypothetical protein
MSKSREGEYKRSYFISYYNKVEEVLPHIACLSSFIMNTLYLLCVEMVDLEDSATRNDQKALTTLETSLLELSSYTLLPQHPHESVESMTINITRSFLYQGRPHYYLFDWQKELFGARLRITIYFRPKQIAPD